LLNQSSIRAELTQRLLALDRITTRSEALSRPAPVPAQPGIYAWYFDVAPPGVPLDGTH
jgi:hypothetical protein